ncbi:MAG: hypothetical protein R2769_06970 [Saprospiraceae bacterium]
MSLLVGWIWEPRFLIPVSNIVEDIQSLSKAAAKGGFTALAPFPNTQPVRQ